MDTTADKVLNIGYLNCRAQTGFNESKQLQIENFLKMYSLDILHLQETHIEENTFSQCSFILSNYEIIHNNSPTKYGTSSLIRLSLAVENIILHHSGRIILFNIGQITFGNVYLPSGTNATSRTSRETYCGEIIPNLMVNSMDNGVIGGDWNNITTADDCTKHPEAKLSPCLKRVIKTFSWRDSFRHIYPNLKHFSHYYDRNGEGATRIDRSYYYGSLIPIDAKYECVSFSDHFSYIVKLQLPDPLSTIISPKSRPTFKIKPEVAKDRAFQARLAFNMNEWEQVRSFGVPILTWWENLVKPGIRKLALERGKELSRERRSLLNLLMMRLSFLGKKIHSGESSLLPALRETQFRIDDWFEAEIEKIKYQTKVDDIQDSEKVRIHHHELHQKHMKRSAILKLDTPGGLIEGHPACSAYLQERITELLGSQADLNAEAQNILLAEIENQFTEDDNIMLAAAPTKAEVEESIKTSNLHAAPGTDSITSFVYKECFHILGDAITDVVKAIHEGEQPTLSQRTSLMVCTSKPGKSGSLDPKDKRRLSLLNSDFKIITGIEVLRFRRVLGHSLSPQQLAEGDNSRITFGICLARDAVYAASMRREGCGLADNDFEAAFDYLCLDWVKLVLEKKGLAKEVLDRFLNIYHHPNDQQYQRKKGLQSPP